MQNMLCSGVHFSESQSQQAESARPSVLRGFLSPQCPVCGRKIMVRRLLCSRHPVLVLLWAVAIISGRPLCFLLLSGVLAFSVGGDDDEEGMVLADCYCMSWNVSFRDDGLCPVLQTLCYCRCWSISFRDDGPHPVL